MLDLAGVRSGERVLEVGCGNGEYLARIDSVGLDLSLGMLASARQRNAGPLVCADAERIPFADRSFDVLLAPHMLYHVADRTAAVHELRRVLVDGGTCVAVTNGEANHRELVDLLEDVVGNGWRWRRPSDTEFSLENGAAQLRAGFRSVERVDCPAGSVLVTDVDALGDYLHSVADSYEREVEPWTSWGAVVAECRRRVADVVEAEGGFRISGSVGAFVCR